MHGLAVGENHDPEPPPACFLYPRPPPDTAIGLYGLVRLAGVADDSPDRK